MNQTETIKSFRLRIDQFINSTSFLITSREVSLAHTNLQRSKMWLGKALGELKQPTPYPNSENPKNAVIEPQAEHTDSDLSEHWKTMVETSFESDKDLKKAYINGNFNPVHIARVKDFRGEIETTAKGIKDFTRETNYVTSDYNGYLYQSRYALEEAKMWLGMELDRIRNIEADKLSPAVLTTPKEKL